MLCVGEDPRVLPLALCAPGVSNEYFECMFGFCCIPGGDGTPPLRVWIKILYVFGFHGRTRGYRPYGFHKNKYNSCLNVIWMTFPYGIIRIK